MPERDLIGKFKNILPFQLTKSQSRVIKEIEEDMKSQKPMNRLLQGDVGSGKTVVGKYLSKKLNLKYYGIGELMREFASRHNLDLISLDKLLERNKKLDKKKYEKEKRSNM